jgi:large subunit ribosomal protein L6
MSRVGKRIIKIPQGVQATKEEGKIKVKGPKGELSFDLHRLIDVEVAGSEIFVKPLELKDGKKDAMSLKKEVKSLWGTVGAIIANMVKGVVSGYEKKLEIVGVGYRARVEGKNLILEVGFSHPVNIDIPENISVSVEKNIISVSGPDKQEVGAIAAKIRNTRKPEPYKGKGIKYIDEVVRRKAGKKAAGATG